jgi:hypothetical protein
MNQISGADRLTHAFLLQVCFDRPSFLGYRPIACPKTENVNMQV